MQDEDLPSILYFEKIKEWMQKNRILLFLIFTAFVLTIILLYKAGRRESENALLAEETYFQFLKDKDEKTLRKLASLSEKKITPYDVPIALYFLQRNEPHEAEPFMMRAISELQKISPYHENYGYSMLALIKSDFQTSLKEAYSLKALFKEKDAKALHPSLYYSNLLRIALLEKKLGNTENELAAWNELGADPDHISWMMELEQNGIAMQDFISDRLKALQR